MIFDIIIIGAGPAGITTAIYAKNAGFKTLIVEVNTIGGKLNSINEIVNYPGYTKITGEQLAENMAKQIESITIVYDKILNITKTNDGTKIAIGAAAQYQGKTIVIATGTKPKVLDLPIPRENISTCELCDGILCTNQNVAVVGGGNSAFTCALYLEKIAKLVTMIIRGSEPKAFMSLVEKAEQSKKINILYNTYISKVSKSRIYLNNGIVCEPFKIFLKIGEIPNTIKTSLSEQDGVYIVGACSGLIPNQIVTAEGDAIKKFVELAKLI